MKHKPTYRRKSSLFPKTLAQCVEPLTRPIFKEKGLAGSRILTEWPSIVGAGLAKHCLPEKLSFPKGKKNNGTLTITVENGFAPDIQHQQPVILERLSAYFGYQAITRIVISHNYVNTVHQPRPTAAKKTPAPLPKSIIDTTKDIEDDALRKSLESFAKTLSQPRT